MEHIVIVEQWRIKRIKDSLLQASFTLAITRAHDSHATIFEHHFHIVKVEVHKAMQCDNFCNAFSSHAQSVVGSFESLDKRQLGVNLSQAFVIDNEQRIHMFSHLFNAIKRLVNLFKTLETERNGDDTHREYAHLFRYTGDDRRCTRTRSTAHTSSDEGHFGAVVEHRFNVFDAFFGCRFSL